MNIIETFPRFGLLGLVFFFGSLAFWIAYQSKNDLPEHLAAQGWRQLAILAALAACAICIGLGCLGILTAIALTFWVGGLFVLLGGIQAVMHFETVFLSQE